MRLAVEERWACQRDQALSRLAGSGRAIPHSGLRHGLTRRLVPEPIGCHIRQVVLAGSGFRRNYLSQTCSSQ